MKIGNKNIKENSAKLFLGIFFLFLVISISHSHHFEIQLNKPSEVSENSQNEKPDIFLDSALNCTIHTFYNNIKFENSFNINEILFSDNITIKYYYHYYLTNTSVSIPQLRAPPIS